MGINALWFKSFLEDKSQITRINNQYSDKIETILRVPQGSILGPALFIAFINDLPTVLVYTKLIFFADDDYLLHSGFVEDEEIVSRQINEDLVRLFE